MAKKQDKVLDGAPPAAPTPPPDGREPLPRAKRFRVWPHGALHVSGAVFGPSEELPLSEAEVEQLGVGPVIVSF